MDCIRIVNGTTKWVGLCLETGLRVEIGWDNLSMVVVALVVVKGRAEGDIVVDDGDAGILVAFEHLHNERESIDWGFDLK